MRRAADVSHAPIGQGLDGTIGNFGNGWQVDVADSWLRFGNASPASTRTVLLCLQHESRPCLGAEMLSESLRTPPSSWP